MTDSQLIQTFLTGEKSAFDTLTWRWEKSVYNFILRYVGDREEAKDLSQKTFIRVYQNLKRLRDHDKFSTWIYQIAINICRDELKRRRRKSILSLERLREKNNGKIEAGLQVEKAAATDPEHRAHNRDLRDLLNKALQMIPEEQRVVIVMKEYQGLKFTEIAETLDTSVNTVKSRMYYGLSALKRIFDGWNLDKEKMTYEV